MLKINNREQACEAISDGGIMHRHIRGSLLLSGVRVMAIVLNFIVQVVTVRYLSKDDYGAFAYAMSISAMLSVILALGMNKVASRFLAVYLQDRDYAKFWGGIFVIFGSIIASFPLIFGVAVVGVQFGFLGELENPQSNSILIFCLWLSLANAIDSVFIAIFAVMASPTAIAFRRYLLAPVTKLVAALVVILIGGGVVAFAIGQLIAGALGVLLCIVMFFKLVYADAELLKAMKVRLHYPVKELLTHGSAVVGGDLAFLSRNAIVPIMLAIYYGSEDVASYLAVHPVARLIEFVLVTFAIQFLPEAARLSRAKEVVHLQKMYESSVCWISMLSFPMFAVCFIGSGLVPRVLFGQDYANASATLAALSMGFFVYASCGISQRLLRATCSVRVILTSDIIITLVSSITLVLLTLHFGAFGGGLAVCITFVFQSMFQILLVSKYTTVNPLRMSCWIPATGGLAICCAAKVVLTLTGEHPVAVLVAIGLSVFATASLYASAVDVGDRHLVVSKIPFVRRLLTVR